MSLAVQVRDMSEPKVATRKSLAGSSSRENGESTGGGGTAEK